MKSVISWLITDRLGLWLDLKNAYETRKARYIEYVWYLIKEAWKRGLLYEGYKVLPYCPRCETALSDAEVSLGYEEKVSPSIYVKIPIEGRPNEYLVIWTTTPWTLIDNEAIAVNPEGTYCKVRVGKEYWIIAKTLLEDVLSKASVKDYDIIEEIRGSDLEGIRYVHPLIDEVPIHKSHRNAHYVVTADFVSLEEGSGLVHIAPAHGPEDFELGLRCGLPITNSVEANGIFNSNGGIFEGLSIDEASSKVIEILKSKGLLIYAGSIKHSYPHCWRCHTPLVYRADKQWFIRVTAFRDRLVRALKDVEIYPEKLRARFENWVANAKDWAISRSRIWGTPLPIWKCRDDPKKVLVIGSIEELKRCAKELPNVDEDKLVHRPWIDMIKIETPDCREWIREPYVLDVWLDSGIAWIASIDGLRNEELFRKLYPYTFVTEAVDQTRGWFYSLLVTSVLLMGVAPYRKILIQELVLDKYGRKMSKHLGNVIWAKDVLEKFGADPVRTYILSRHPPGDTLMFDPDEIKDIISKLNIIWNIFRFALTYMVLDKFSPKLHTLNRLLSKAKIEDRWILSRVNSMLKKYIEYAKVFELHKASREVLNFFVEDLSHRYLRLIRPRVWQEVSEDRYVVYAVLYYVLIRALKALAPIAPHLAEALWLKFFKVINPELEESIHLSTIEKIDEELIDEGLEKLFEDVFKVASVVASLRNKIGIKLRWPIRRVIIVGRDKELLKDLAKAIDVIKFLCNSKDVELVTTNVCTDEYVYEDITDLGLKVCIPKGIDEELYLEALARELIRRIQVMRNRLNLRVEEFIIVGIESKDTDILKAIEKFKNYIAGEVRAKEIISSIDKSMYRVDWSIDGKKVSLGIKRLS